jgi:hypothetical protein
VRGTLAREADTIYVRLPTVGPYTTADLMTALNTGRLLVGIDSARHPGGELRGAFIVANGSQTSTPPAASPALSPNALRNPSETDAARFLTQATCGPKLGEITGGPTGSG